MINNFGNPHTKLNNFTNINNIIFNITSMKKWKKKLNNLLTFLFKIKVNITLWLEKINIKSNNKLKNNIFSG
jgi:hypothetical protein